MTIGTPESFAADVLAFAEKAKVSVLAVVIETIRLINLEIMVLWPVVTGFSRASWFAVINGTPAGAPGTGNAYQLELVAGRLQIGQTYVAANSAAYALRLENGFVGTDSLGRSYNQSGRFIVRGVLVRAPFFAEQAAQKVAARNGV